MANMASQQQKERLFRVQNIPCPWSLEALETILRKCFNSDEITVTSFHTPCYPAKTKSAILGCRVIPDRLIPLEKGEYGAEILIAVNSHQLLFDAAFLGLTMLSMPEREESIDLDIILIHGIGSHAIGAWVSKVGSCWPRDFLGADFPSARIMAFGHNSKLHMDSSTSRLSDYGTQFINAAISARRLPEAKSRSLVLIGHSFGGTIITYALHQLRTVDLPGYCNLYHAIKCVVFFGTPHQGTSVESLVPLVKDRSEPSKKRVLRDLEPGSDMGRVLRSALTSSATEHIKFITCVEQKTAMDQASPESSETTPVVKRSSGNIHVVEREASIYALGEIVIPVDADHKNLNKFSHAGNDSYQSIVSHLHGVLLPVLSEGQIFCFTAIDVVGTKEFIGRSTELKLIHELLNKDRSSGEMGRAAIVGVAGVGKTQLALQYMEKYRRDYYMLFLIDNSNPVTFGEHISALVRRLTGKEPERVTSINLDTISKWMQGNPKKRVLIVIDNFNDGKSHISRSGFGDILITTTSEISAKMFANKRFVKLEEWSNEEACEYLRQKTQQEVSEQTLASLSREVDRLPIAMDFIVSYTSFKKQTFEETLQDLYRDKTEFLKLVLHEANVNKTFGMIFKELDRKYSSAVDFASILAFLEPRSLGEDLFKEHNEGFYPKNPALFKDLNRYQVRNNARTYLLDLGLLRKSSGTEDCSFHDLAHVFIRERLTDDKKVPFLTEALHFVWKNFPVASDTHKPDVWRMASYYLPHAVAVLGHAESLGLNSEEIVDLLVRASGILVEKGFGEDAKRLSKLAHSCASKLPGYPADKLVRSILSAGYVLNYLNDPKAAKPYYEEAVEKALRNLKPEHEDTITSIHNLAGIYVQENDLSKAEKWFDLAVKYGRQHYLNATHGVNPFASMISLAEVYRSQKKFQEADGLLREAERGFRARQTDQSSWTLYCIAQLGKNLLEQGIAGDELAWDEAESKLVKAAEGLQTVLGSEDRYTREAVKDLETLRETIARKGK